MNEEADRLMYEVLKPLIWEQDAMFDFTEMGSRHFHFPSENTFYSAFNRGLRLLGIKYKSFE